MAFAELHFHCDYGSNVRLIDSTNKIEPSIDYAISLGLRGLAFTDHESLSAHIKALNYGKVVHEAHPDFQIILGNEIYLCHDTPPVTDEASGKTRFAIESKEFFHFILLAKDAEGHRQLRELSTRAWGRSYSYKNQVRVPTFYSDLDEVVGENRGHLIASTACLGGEFDKLTLDGDVNSALSFVRQCQSWFGKDDFYIELQPGISNDQILFNQRAITFSKYYGLKWIITNDVHYQSKDKRELHATFLNSKEEERELADFYESTYFKREEEMKDRMRGCMSDEDIEAGFAHTIEIADKCKDAGDYGLFHDTIVPQRALNDEPVLQGLFADWYDSCPSVKYLAESPYEQDRFFLQECEKGIINKHIPVTEKVVKRIDIEVQQLIGISKRLNSRLTSYYNLMQAIEDVIWQVSIIGTGRGSACCLYCAYLMDITQVDSLKENLPYWRHTHISKVSLPDIDIDLCPSKRPQVFEMLKDKFGRDKCLNIITFGTETLKSAIKTSCRGLGVDNDTAQDLSNLVPVTRGRVWSYQECLHGNEDNGFIPITELINKINAIPNLHETIQEIEGLITHIGSHASGFYIMARPYLEMSSMMRTPGGADVTCWEMEDQDQTGALKFDLLVTDAVEKLQKTMDYLVSNQYMEWQGDLKSTYMKYLHPDVLDYDSPAMWDLVGQGKIVDLFQFMSDVGVEAIKKIKPRSLKELALTSSLMRLMGDEPPIDRYVAIRNDPAILDQEMKDAGLNENEQKIVKRHLGETFGCSVHQEDVMELSMDEDISGFDMADADYLRKIIGKKKIKLLPKVKEMFYSAGEKRGTRKQMLDYVWAHGFLPQLGYSFNKPHVLAYATIALQEMNLFYKYPPIFWQCAVLSINASANEDDVSGKTTNYGKTAAAISNMQKQKVVVVLPEINEADFGFKPDVAHNRIIFGLRAIVGVNDATASSIIANRPYLSMEDFFMKNPMPVKASVSLIKAGCFDELEARPRVQIMRDYCLLMAKSANPPKPSLDMKNLKAIIALGILPKEFDIHRRVTNFRANLKTGEIRKADENGKPTLQYSMKKMGHAAVVFFENELAHYLDEGVQFHYDEYDVLLSAKPFEKWYKTFILPVNNWIKLPQTLDAFNTATVRQAAQTLWNDNCTEDIGGNLIDTSIPQWEMESVSFYYTAHELAPMQGASYGVENFFALPAEPEVVGTFTRKRKDGSSEDPDTTWNKYKLDRIAGTVLDKNKNRHSITLLTTTGVVNVKFYAGAFASYDKQISRIDSTSGKKTVVEKSWFTRGTHLIITGIRKGDVFMPKIYRDSIYQHAVCLIRKVWQDGSLLLQNERAAGKEDDET